MPLAGHTLFLVGRLQGLTRKRLDRLVRAQGGRLAARPGARVTVIAFGHSATSQALDDGRVRLPAGLPATASLISENVLRRQLGLLEPPPEVERGLGRDEVERLSSLTPSLLSCLMLFDVLEPVDERFAYRDLVAAREAARLLKRGVPFADVLDASLALRRRGSHLAEARLTEGPSGELVREIAGQLAELSGQLTMRLDRTPRSIDDLVARVLDVSDQVRQLIIGTDVDPATTSKLSTMFESLEEAYDSVALETTIDPAIDDLQLSDSQRIALARRADHRVVGAPGATQHDARQHIGTERKQRQAEERGGVHSRAGMRLAVERPGRDRATFGHEHRLGGDVL